MVSIIRSSGESEIVRPSQNATRAISRSNGRLPFETSGPDETRHINGLIYGDTGAGKTHLFGTVIECPDMLPALLLDIDGGSLTLQGISPELIQIARPKGWKEIQEIYRYLFFDNHRFRSLFVDTLTENQRRHSMGTILGEVDQLKDGYYKNLADTPVANRQDWLKSSGQTTKFIQAFRGLSYLRDSERRMHVLFSAHEKSDDKRHTVSPELTGALGVQCGRWVDILGRLSVHMVEREDEETGEVTLEEIRHLLVSQYTAEDGTRYLAKNRGGRLGRSVWDPTMAKLSAAWKEAPEPNGQDDSNDE